MKVDFKLSVSSLSKQLEHFWQVATQKVTLLEKQYDASKGSPVFTVEGRYSTRGWTERRTPWKRWHTTSHISGFTTMALTT